LKMELTSFLLIGLNYKKMDKSITSNSCVGGYLYLFTESSYLTPLVSSLFLEDFMYIKFLENYDYYMKLTPKFIENYNRDIKLKGHTEVVNNYILMMLGDIEIHWIHESSINVFLPKWNRRIDRSLDKERTSIWTTSEFMQYHNDEERKLLISRFCNLPEYSVLLTERKEEEVYEKNYAIIFVPQWENKQQNDRHVWGFLKWNDQLLQKDIYLSFLKKRI